MRICCYCGKYQPHASPAHTDEPDADPGDGDLSICIACGEWNVFEGDHLRKPTDDEFEEIGTDVECHRVRAAWLEMDRYRRSQAT